MDGQITIPELRKWLGKYGRSSLSDEACERLINLLWHKDERAARRQNADDFDWDWDIADVAKAAETLQTAMPHLNAWWHAMRPNDQTDAARTAVGWLGRALDAAMPYVAHPFGEQGRADGTLLKQIGAATASIAVRIRRDHPETAARIDEFVSRLPEANVEKARKRRSKEDWHLPSVIIANALSKELRAAGYGVLGFTRNSIPVRVVRELLIRWGYNVNTIGLSAIASHLDRWWKDYGRPK